MKYTLYPSQEEAAVKLTEAIRKYGSALDASDTGVGKTFTALGVAKLMNTKPLVIAPKAVLTSWKHAAEGLGVEVLDILNIEKLKAGKTQWLKSHREPPSPNGRKKKRTFVWTLPPNTMIIWDEVQNAGGNGTENAKILALTKAYGIRVLCLSATVAESPLKLKAVGYLLGLHHYRDHYSWCLRNGCYKGLWGGLQFTTAKSKAHRVQQEIHKHIFPERGVRMRIQELDSFPENTVLAEAFNLDRGTKEVNQIYDEMEDHLKNPDDQENPLTIQLYARQQTELLKLPLLRDLACDLLDEGKSVVVFLNFKESLNRFIEEMKGRHPDAENIVSIYGGQSREERDKAIAEFQADRSRIIVSMIQAGGVGISLHDLRGEYPRVSLINPNYNAVQLKQALGRIHRAGAKTKCLQIVVFIADTIEEVACEAVKRKLDNLSLLNDGDLSGGLFTVDSS